LAHILCPFMISEQHWLFKVAIWGK
jgi:hypothetical protein